MPEVGTCTGCGKRRRCFRTVEHRGWRLLCRVCFAEPEHPGLPLYLMLALWRNGGRRG